MPGEQALQIARAALQYEIGEARWRWVCDAGRWGAAGTYPEIAARFGEAPAVERLTAILAEIDAALAAEGSEEQGSSPSPLRSEEEEG